MSNIRKKILAIFSNTFGQILATAILCAVCVCIVLYATSMSVSRKDTMPQSHGTILAFAADSSSDLTGKLLESAFLVTLKVNGESNVVMVSAATVSEALEDAGFHLQKSDLVTPSLDSDIEEFDEIEILRCDLETYTEKEPLPYETYYNYSPDVAAGKEIVEQAGEEGVQVEIYSRLVYRGEVIEENLVDTVVEKEPVHEKILMGFRSMPVSSLDFGWTFDDNGEPVEYSSVLRSSSAAGYSAPSTAGTASGLPAKVGHVAVDPGEIPYGSKLFIQSPDGSFIYGYAIAADTGTALMQNIIDVDLFYATYAQSAANGIKEVDIFILE